MTAAGRLSRLAVLATQHLTWPVERPDHVMPWIAAPARESPAERAQDATAVPAAETRVLRQDVFDVYGRWWWLLWLLPRRAPKQGDGVSCSAAK